MGSIQQNSFELPAEVKTQFKKSFDGSSAEIVYPGDPKYDELIKRWSDTCEKRAGAIFLPKSAQDVTKAVNVLRDSKIDFTVAGGRHSTSGSSSIEDGVVIDMRLMRKAVVDEAAKTITAQGGCVWEDVDVEAAKFGLATVGGTVNHTGVAGLTLGGGYGWLTGRHGLAIDNLVRVEMVLADGQIVTASQDSHPDLFWAVRGAGQCFGIATELTFKVYPQSNVWAGMYAFTPDKLSKVADFANWTHENNDGDKAMLFAFTKPPQAPGVVVLTAMFYNGPEEEAVEYYKPLASLGPIIQHVDTIPYEKLNGLFSQEQGFGGRKIFGGSNVAMPLDLGFLQATYDELAAFIEKHDNTVEGMVAFELIPYKKISEIPLEETAIANRGEYYNVGTLFKWKDPTKDAEIRLFNRQINAKIRESGGNKKTKGTGVYANYLQEDCPPREVFGSNTPKLRELKTKYDPSNLFRSWHNLMPN